MPTIIATTWGAVPSYAHVIDRSGTTYRLGHIYRFVGLTYAETPNGGLVVHNDSESCAMVEPTTADAILNLMRAGFTIEGVSSC